eukprot:Gb_19809 [translate_table: standard]
MSFASFPSNLCEVSRPALPQQQPKFSGLQVLACSIAGLHGQKTGFCLKLQRGSSKTAVSKLWLQRSHSATRCAMDASFGGSGGKADDFSEILKNIQNLESLPAVKQL